MIWHLGLGGTDEVGASAHLYLLGEDLRVLIDAGVRPGLMGPDSLPQLELLDEFPPTHLLLTHAHLDHVGALPLVVRRFPFLRIFATPLTIALAGVVLRDSYKINQSQPVQLFSKADLERTLAAFEPRDFDQPWTLRAPGAPAGLGEAEVQLRRAGHLPGAAQVELSWGGRRVLHAGDVSNVAGALTPSAYLPEAAEVWDGVTVESTYGDTELPARRLQIRALVQQVDRTLRAGGQVLIPTFALGRAQEILRALITAQRGGLLTQAPLVLDGLTREVTTLLEGSLDQLPPELAREQQSGQRPLLAGQVHLVASSQERGEILKRRGPQVVLASGGMLSAGVSPLYAQHWLPRPENSLLIVGYQDAESPGRRLSQLSPGEQLRLPSLDLEVTVAAQVDRLYLSAHADRLGLTALIRRRQPERLLLVHGEHGARRSLAHALGTTFDARLPARGERVELSDGGRRRTGFLMGSGLGGRPSVDRQSSESSFGEQAGPGDTSSSDSVPAVQSPRREQYLSGTVQATYAQDRLVLDLSALSPRDRARFEEIFPSGPVRFEGRRLHIGKLKLREAPAESTA